MDQRLFIEIGLNNQGNILPVDNTPYERWGEDIHNHAVIERVFDSEENVLETRIKEMDHFRDYEYLRHTEPFEITNDGLYTYQKLIIPLKEHVGNAKFYYYDGSLYDALTNETLSFEEVWDKKATSTNMFWFDEEIFSIYNLLECFILTELARINDMLNNGCDVECSSFNSDTNADFLGVVIFVLLHLIKTRDFYNAQRILDRLNTCNGLCKHVNDKLKGCGCNGNDSKQIDQRFRKWGW